MEVLMSVTVSSKYQVVIPKGAREAANIKPGQKLEVLAIPGRISFVKALSLKELRGRFKGIPVDGYRDREDRL
jgi:AbrB family looped-hinge helix DNA binding protein